MKRRIQNTIAESALTLPAFGFVALLLWTPWKMRSMADALPLLLSVLACYVLMEWGNRWQIIRIRTRLTTSLFALAMGAVCPLCGSAQGVGIAVAVVAMLFCLSACYEAHEPVGCAFHAALCLSVASLVLPSALLLWPVMLFCLMAYLRAFSMRVLSATMLGVLLPWFFFTAWTVAQGAPVAPFPAPVWGSDDTLVTSSPLGGTGGGAAAVLQLAWGVTSALGLVSALHFFKTSYDDKIRTRQLLYMVVVLWLAVQALALFVPGALPLLLPSLLLLASPLLAHHLALSHSWWGTVWLVLTLASMAVLAVLAR